MLETDADVKPPDDFRELSVIPTREVLLEDQPFLRPNIVNGAYSDVEHYLDVQFRLLREDCIGPIRVGISMYLHYHCTTYYIIKYIQICLII